PAWGGDVTPCGRWLAIAGWNDHRAQVWDLAAEPPQRVWEQSIASSYHLRGVAISDDGNTVVIGDSDGDISVFDVPSGTRRHTWKAHRGVINDVDLSTDGR